MRSTRAVAALCLTLPLALSALSACGGTDSEVGESASTSTPLEASGTPSPNTDVTALPDDVTAEVVAEACPSSFTTGRDGEEVRATVEEFTGEGTIWLCSYHAGDAEDRWQEWTLASTPIAVESTESSEVTDLVAGLGPADENRPCRADFGPSLLLSQEIRDGEHVHLVIEDYGCSNATLATNLAHTTLGWTEPALATRPGDVAALKELLKEK